MTTSQHAVSSEITGKLYGLLEKFDKLRGILDTSPADFRISQHCDEEPALVRDTALDAVHRVRLAIFDLISTAGAVTYLDSRDTLQTMRACLDEISASISQLDAYLRQTLTPDFPDSSRHIRMFIERVEEAAEIVRCSVDAAYTHGGAPTSADSNSHNEIELDWLLQTCSQFGLSSLQERAEVLVKQRTTDSLHLLFVGQVNSGKTSLINLVAPTANLPTGPVPTTAATTLIESAKRTGIHILFSNGSRTEVSATQLDEYLNAQWNRNNARHVSLVKVDLPATNIGDGLVIIDSPGIDGVETSGWWWRSSQYFDLAVLIVDAQGLCNLDLRIASRALDLGGELAVFINKADQLSLREQWQVLEHADKVMKRSFGEHIPIYLSSAKEDHQALNAPWLEGLFKESIARRAQLREGVRTRRIGKLRRDTVSTLSAKIHALESKSSPQDLENRSTRCHQALCRAEHCLENPPTVSMIETRYAATISEAVSEACENIVELIRQSPDDLVDPAPLILSSLRSRVSSDAESLIQQLRQREAAFREFVTHARQAISDSRTDFDGHYPRLPVLPEIDFGPLTAGRFFDELRRQSHWRTLHSRAMRALANLRVFETLEVWTCGIDGLLNETAQGWAHARRTWLDSERSRLTDPRNSVAMRLSAMQEALTQLTSNCVSGTANGPENTAGAIGNNI
ncbi:dynamin family protein [Pandoraea sp. B-6]|uniref:dynamin family protein n=1 Tax=Pandoraea sp. B-6 TaxID=1204340 RepID=UPI000362CE90|nr:dynamin family protein [Pandoraea sp. B-6]